MEFDSLRDLIEQTYAAVERRLSLGSWPKGWPGNLYSYLVRFAAVDPEVARAVVKERREWYEVSDKAESGLWLDRTIKKLQQWERLLRATKPATPEPVAAVETTGVIAPDPPAAAEATRKPSVNAMVIDLMMKTPESHTWSARKIATILGCGHSAVNDCDAFQKLKTARGIARLERAEKAQKKQQQQGRR